MGRVSGTIVVEYEVLVMSCTVKLWSDQYQEVVMALLCNEDIVVACGVAILSPISISQSRVLLVGLQTWKLYPSKSSCAMLQ